MCVDRKQQNPPSRVPKRWVLSTVSPQHKTSTRKKHNTTSQISQEHNTAMNGIILIESILHRHYNVNIITINDFLSDTNPLMKYMIYNHDLGHLTKILCYQRMKYDLDSLVSIDTHHTVTQSVPQRFCHESRHRMYAPPTVRRGVETLQGVAGSLSCDGRMNFVE